MNKKIMVITGSVRAGRNGDKIASWVMEQLKRREDFDYELIDLKELNLPFLDEPVPPMMSTEPVNEHTREWKKIVAASDGFIFVTPEYNHGYSPALKNALDYLYAEWKGKPAAFVGYGGSGAVFAIEQLRQVVDFLGIDHKKYTVNIREVWDAIDSQGNVKSDYVSGTIAELADKLEASLSPVPANA